MVQYIICKVSNTYSYYKLKSMYFQYIIYLSVKCSKHIYLGPMWAQWKTMFPPWGLYGRYKGSSMLVQYMVKVPIWGLCGLILAKMSSAHMCPARVKCSHGAYLGPTRVNKWWCDHFGPLGPYNSVYGQKGRMPTYDQYRTRRAKVRCAYIKFDFNSTNKFQNKTIVHTLNYDKNRW